MISGWILEPETREKVFQHLDKFIIADDVTLEDATAQTAVIASRVLLGGSTAVDRSASARAAVCERRVDCAAWWRG